MQIGMEPIGHVVNDIDTPTDCDWAGVESTIVLQEHLGPALAGISQFSHLVIVFWLHQAQPPATLKRRPQNRDDMPEVGLFSQRSKHRPNPIGITAVSLIKVHDCELIVRGLDAINGTPVLDIKPYYPQYDCRSEARVPEWADRLMRHYF